MAKPAYTIARESYERCLKAPDFFSYLYAYMLESDPAIPAMFADTEFPRQHRLLQHGLGLLLSYARQPDDELLDRIAARHSKAGIDVPPRFYENFQDSLVHAVSESDPEFSPEIARAWRQAVTPGIRFMSGRYE